MFALAFALLALRRCAAAPTRASTTVSLNFAPFPDTMLSTVSNYVYQFFEYNNFSSDNVWILELGPGPANQTTVGLYLLALNDVESAVLTAIDGQKVTNEAGNALVEFSTLSWLRGDPVRTSRASTVSVVIYGALGNLVDEHLTAFAIAVASFLDVDTRYVTARRLETGSFWVFLNPGKAYALEFTLYDQSTAKVDAFRAACRNSNDLAAQLRTRGLPAVTGCSLGPSSSSGSSTSLVVWSLIGLSALMSAAAVILVAFVLRNINKKVFR